MKVLTKNLFYAIIQKTEYDKFQFTNKKIQLDCS